MVDEPVVSYAQHGEDIVLLRALGDTENGFYVDVGAYDPTSDSVTRLFYERGWRGVNIDPSTDVIEKFAIERPDEVNLAVAAGDRDGEAELFVSDVPGWSTTNAVVGEGLEGQHHVTRRVTVRMRRLSSILDSLPTRRVDFLKVDAEGSESDVIAGLDLDRHRPRVIVLEGVAPTVGDLNVAPALQMLSEAGYIRAGFDGLNHYLTCEPVLVARLAAPANPTDLYERHSDVQLRSSVAALQGDLRDRDAQVSALEQSACELSRVHESWERARQERDQLAARSADREATIVALEQARDAALADALQRKQELDGIKAGISWKVTAPIRRVGDLGRPGRGSAIGNILARGDGFVRRFPVWRDRAIVLVDRFPAVAARVRRFLERHKAARRSRTHMDFDAIAGRRDVALSALVQRARDRQQTP